MEKEKALKQLSILSKKSKNMRLAVEKWNSEFQTLITTILSARSRDEKTIPVAMKLFSKYPDAKKLASAKISDIEKIIKPINFYKNKARNIINTSEKIVKEYNGKVPESMDKLLELPGVGRKTANIFLSEQGKPAIAVDTHVSYISQKLGWTENKKPEKIEQDLKRLFPKKFWNEVNPALVRFGKTHMSRKEKDKILEQIKDIK